jgi:hypothetical protein
VLNGGDGTKSLRPTQTGAEASTPCEQIYDRIHTLGVCPASMFGRHTLMLRTSTDRALSDSPAEHDRLDTIRGFGRCLVLPDAHDCPSQFE